MDNIDHDLAVGSAPIPLTILTGFLGAGKTTLLNRILNGNHGLKVAVLVNDFGSINIDAELVVGVESNVISLANGCVCCTIRDDLVETVMAMINRPERPEYILLEASGVAEPTGIAVTFNNPRFRDRIRLDSILCVVDAEQVFAAPELMELKIFQMACADMVILNKVDLVDREQIAKITAWLDSRFHRYRLIEARHCNVPLEVLLSVGRFDPVAAESSGNEFPRSIDQSRLKHVLSAVEGPTENASLESPSGDFSPTQPGNSFPGGGPAASQPCHDNHDHAKVFSTWSYESDQPLSLEALREAASKLPANIYRAKGVIHTADAPDRRAVLQVVGRRVDITLDGGWNLRPPRTQIVAIGATGAIDAEALRMAFERCLSVTREQTT